MEQAHSGAQASALLIEADEAYRATIAACLRLAGCAINQVRSPHLALGAMARRHYDLIVWGVNDDGLSPHSEVVAELKLHTQSPLVMVASGADIAQFDLEAGADAWVSKPFVPGVLVGSLRAALRHASAPTMAISTRVDVRGMILDGGTRTLSMGLRQTTFTRQEWDLLSILLAHPDRFLGAREIVRLGWRAGEHGPEQVRTYVSRLRQKMDPMELPCRLTSQHGQGYRLEFN